MFLLITCYIAVAYMHMYTSYFVQKLYVSDELIFIWFYYFKPPLPSPHLHRPIWCPVTSFPATPLASLSYESASRVFHRRSQREAPRRWQLLLLCMITQHNYMTSLEKPFPGFNKLNPGRFCYKFYLKLPPEVLHLTVAHPAIWSLMLGGSISLDHPPSLLLNISY